jgi:hypothetical protein
VSYFFTEFGPNMTTFVLPSELYPVSMRTTGDGISAGIGKLGAFIGVFLFPVLQTSLPSAASPNPNQADQTPHRPPDPYRPPHTLTGSRWLGSATARPADLHFSGQKVGGSSPSERASQPATTVTARLQVRAPGPSADQERVPTVYFGTACEQDTAAK